VRDRSHVGSLQNLMLLLVADMLAYAIDNQTPATIILISGDHDFAYAVSILRLRNYCVVVVAPPIIHASLKSQASILVDWNHDILGKIEADPESPKKPPSSVGGSPLLSSKYGSDSKISPTCCPSSLPSSSRLAEPVEDSKNVGQNGRLNDKHLTDSSQSGQADIISVYGISQEHPHVSSTSVPDTKVQPFAYNTTTRNSFFSTNLSPPQNRLSEEPLVPITAGSPGSVKHLHTHMASLISASGQLDYKPGIFQQTHNVSGGTSLSAVKPNLKFGTGLSQRPSVLSGPGDSVETPGSRGSLSDSHLVPESSIMPAVSKIRSRHFSTVEPPAGDNLSSISSKVPTAGRSFVESLETDISFLNTTASCPSIPSSSTTSTTIQTRPGIVNTSQLSSAPEYSGYQTEDVNAAMSRQTPQKIPANPETPRATLPISTKVQNNISCVSPTRVSAKASIAATNHGSAVGKSDESATRLLLKNMTPSFRILIELLELQRVKGVSRPLRSLIAEEIMKQDALAFGQAGVDTFGQYIALASKAGIVITGGVEGSDWISMHPALQSPLALSSSGIRLPSPQFTDEETGSAAAVALYRGSREHRTSKTIAESTGNTEVLHQSNALESLPVKKITHVSANAMIPSKWVQMAAIDDAPPPEINDVGLIQMTEKSDHLTHSRSFRPRSVPPEFEILVQELEKQGERGLCRPLRSSVAIELVKQDELVYKRAGVSRFKDYIALAVEAQVVVIGGAMGDAWISLPPGETPALIYQKVVPSLPGTSGFPQQFQMLIEQLQRSRLAGADRPLRSLVGQMLLDHNKAVYKEAGFEGFKDYIAAAEKAGIIQLGGVGGSAWISLCG
jgi:hypothetical protein